MSHDGSEVRGLSEVQRTWQSAGPGEAERLSGALATANERIKELEGMARELADALEKHRADMHRESSRPCRTCRQSAQALKNFAALVTHPKETTD